MANAGYRQIHPEIWSDPWFLELTPNEKLIFIYMFSNDRTSLSGLYEISVKQILFETGVPEQDFIDLIEKCKRDKKIVRDENIFFVVNLLKRHFSRSSKVITRIKNDVGCIPDCEPKRVFMDKYSQLIGYRYPIDTQTHEDEDEVKDKDEDNSPPNFFSQFQAVIGLLLAGDKDFQYLKTLIKDYGEEKILKIAAWLRKKDPDLKSMRNALRSIDTAASNWGETQKQMGEVGKEFTADQILGVQQ